MTAAFIHASNRITLRTVLPAFIAPKPSLISCSFSLAGIKPAAIALAATSSLRRDEQFANLTHADGAFAEQMAGDRALRCIFREPERIVRRKPVIDHHP